MYHLELHISILDNQDTVVGREEWKLTYVARAVNALNPVGREWWRATETGQHETFKEFEEVAEAYSEIRNGIAEVNTSKPAYIQPLWAALCNTTKRYSSLQRHIKADLVVLKFEPQEVSRRRIFSNK